MLLVIGVDLLPDVVVDELGARVSGLDGIDADASELLVDGSEMIEEVVEQLFRVFGHAPVLGLLVMDSDGELLADQRH